MADEYKINVRDVDDTSAVPAGAYYVPQDDIGGQAPASIVYANISTDVSGDDPVYHCDMTLDEIIAAIEAGSYVIARHGDVFSPIVGYSNASAQFVDISLYNGKLNVTSILVAADNTVTTSDATITADV